MDYVSYVRTYLADFISLLKGLSTSTKIAILAVLASLAFIAYLRSRDTAGNNIRRARALHKKAVELHEKGKSAEAFEHYRQAENFREKAEAQK